MKLGWVYYICGLCLILLSIILVICGLTGLGGGILASYWVPKSLFSFFAGVAYALKGSRKINNERLRKAGYEVYDHEDLMEAAAERKRFLEMNCNDCRFLNKTSECTRPEKPIIDNFYCLSFEPKVRINEEYNEIHQNKEIDAPAEH